MAKTTAKLNNLRIAPRKSKLVADLIKGLDINEAFDQLDVYVKRSSPYLKKLLSSAVANGENDLGLDKNNLYVYDVKVNAGPVFKRWRPRAFGRAGKILKRTSKIEIILEERIEGKGRKTKEQIEKARKEKIQANKKIEKERAKKETEKNQLSETQESKKIRAEKIEELKKREEPGKKEKQKKGLVKKIFRRKSM